MICIGEQTHTLDKLLRVIAQSHTNTLETTLSTWLTLLEPALMIIIALFSGALVSGLYIPLIQLGQVL